MVVHPRIGLVLDFLHCGELIPPVKTWKCTGGKCMILSFKCSEGKSFQKK